MSDLGLEIPERVEEGNHEFLNCKVGQKVRPESDEELKVLESLESALAGDFLQIYYKYPDTGDDENEDLDVVALHPNVGVVVLEILTIDIEQVEKIRGPDWYLEGQSRPIRPTSVVSDGKVGVRHQFEKRNELTNDEDRSTVPFQNYVVLPNVHEKEWNEKFPDNDTKGLLFADILEDRDTFGNLLVKEDTELTEEELRDSLGALKFSDSISGDQLNTAASPNTKRELLEHINQRLKILTDKQLRIGLQAPDAPQQIRGIAGSGKTVVTAFRAAKLHWENEDWNIAVTFRNHGLRQTHEDLISAFYEQFSGGDDLDRNRLDIFNGWGGSSKPGMYSTIASESNANRLSYKEARRKFRYSSRLLGRCCKDVLKKGGIPKIYDAILIDEGQDFPPSFFKMCYKAATNEKRIYWSYDEAQNLATLEAKSAKELFGTENDDPRVDVSEKLEGGVNSTHVMRTSFRTPRSVLMTAHGFGMGMYRDGPVIQAISNKEGWDNIGYIVQDGNFKHAGNEVTLKRPLKHSPHPLWDYQTPSELIGIEWADTRDEEVEMMVNDVENLIREEDVLPEEILITYLWPYEIRDEPLKLLIDSLEDKFSERDQIVNDVSNVVRQDGMRGKFREPGEVSLSNIHHSRGNQSSIVYVLGLDMVAEETSKELAEGGVKAWRNQHVKIRNQAFVGFTRTKGWLNIYGTDPTSRIAGELNEVLNDTRNEDPELNMKVPSNDSPFKDLEPRDFTQTRLGEEDGF